jgi:hypothetical protein
MVFIEMRIDEVGFSRVSPMVVPNDYKVRNDLTIEMVLISISKTTQH